MANISFFFLRLLVELLRLLPFRLLYVFSDFLVFLLYRMIGYRKAVITENLRTAFPEKSAEEIKQITLETYRNLTDVTLETIKSFTTPVTEIQRRCQVLNPEIVADVLNQGQSVMLVGSHVNNWEYAALAMPMCFDQPMFGVYKPLTNKVIEDYMTGKRGRGGIAPIPMEVVLGVMRKQQRTVASYMFIADQSPSSRKRAHWVTFFGRPTACLPGTDVLARTFDYPVFSYRIKRIKRGFYTVEFAPLWLDPKESSEGEITRLYKRLLEEEIRQNPESWLWSHKRWKMKPE